MQYAIVDFVKNVDSLLHTVMVIESDGSPAANDNNILSTVVCRGIISQYLFNLCLAMPNCPMETSVSVLYCEHFSETRNVPVTSLAHPNSIDTYSDRPVVFFFIFLYCSG